MGAAITLTIDQDRSTVRSMLSRSGVALILAERTRRWLTLAFLLAVVTAGLTGFGFVPEPLRWVSLALLSIGPPGCIIALYIRCASLVRAAVRARCMCCGACGHDLRGCPIESDSAHSKDARRRCPECGAVCKNDSSLRWGWVSLSWLVRPSGYRRLSNRANSRRGRRG